MPSPNPEDPPTSVPVVEKVQAILASKGLTLYKVSRQSAAQYGRSSPFFVPHNLYYDLRSKRFSPSIYHIFTLSRISGYRVRDWLRVFGFELEDIPRLQVLLPSKRTILLDTSLTNTHSWILWFHDRAFDPSIPAIAPLTKLLKFTSPRRISSILKSNQNFLYAKIGREDALGFPELIPGSIVRANRAIPRKVFGETNSEISDRLFLIETSKGFCCCRLRFLPNDVIVPVDNGLSYAQVELRVPLEARILGVVDLELRPLLPLVEPEVPRDLALRWSPQSLANEQRFGDLLSGARQRLQISTREAARISRTIAELLKDLRYTSSSSSLSDYELHNTPPRHFHTIIAICSIYGLHLELLMRAMGIEMADSGREPLPDGYLTRGHPIVGSERVDKLTRSAFLEKLLDECSQEVPFFLRDLLGYFSGPTQVVVLDDLFWIGGDLDPVHPYLSQGLLALVNRRRKAPVHLLSKPLWQQPIYMVLARDGKYLAASFGIENDKLVMYPLGQDFHPSVEFRHHRDAEVVGQIVGIARRIG